MVPTPGEPMGAHDREVCAVMALLQAFAAVAAIEYEHRLLAAVCVSLAAVLGVVAATMSLNLAWLARLREPKAPAEPEAPQPVAPRELRGEDESRQRRVSA